MNPKLLGLSILALLTGCASGPPGPRPEPLYAGFYESGFEVESFHPCGSDERWWVAEGDALHARYWEIAGEYGRVYAELRGHVSESGRFGHMAAYARMLRVAEVVVVDPERTRCPDGRIFRLPSSSD